MDIFDDFDPQQYDYDESDQEDDIVYLEGPVEGEDPFLPYLAKDDGLSQTQASQPTQENQPNLLPRRERQRRREEQMMHQEESSSDSEYSNQEEGEHDAFASLQSLLEKQSQQEKETKAALDQDESVANGDTKEEEAKEEETTVPGNESSSIVDQEPDHEVPVQDTNDNLIPETQSQFPLAEDWEPSQEEANLTQETTRAIPMVSQHYTAAQHANMSMDGPSISSGLIKELRRAQQKKDIASKPFAAMNPPRAVNSNLLSELEKNRKRAALEKKTRPKKQATGVGSIHKSQRPQFHRNRPQTTRVAKDTKSIVGSR